VNIQVVKTINTYTVHICRYHSSLYEQRIGNNHRELDFDINDYNFCLNEENLSLVSNNAGNLSQISDDAVHYVKAVSKLYLNLSTKYFLTERGLRAVIDSISSVTELYRQYFIDTLTERMICKMMLKRKLKICFKIAIPFLIMFIILQTVVLKTHIQEINILKKTLTL